MSVRTFCSTIICSINGYFSYNLFLLHGVVAGLLSKTQDAFSASIAGVYLSAIAANLAYQKVGLHMVATDLIEQLPYAIKPFDKIV